MSEKLKKALLELAKGICTALVGFLTALLVSSCGSTTRAVVRNNATNTQTEIKITTNNPSSVTVTPNTDANINL